MRVPGLKLKTFGALSLVEMYEYYDGPKLFMCKAETGALFLALWTGMEETHETFLLVYMTPERYGIVRSGGLSLLRAFQQPEMGFVISSIFLFQSEETKEIRLDPDEIDVLLLPAPGESLDLPTESLPIRMSDLDLPRKAEATKREHLGLHLYFRDLKREEAPTRELGRLLFSMQEIIESIAQGINGQTTTRGAIPPPIVRAAETRVVQAGGGSFGLELSAAEAVDLFGRSLISDAVGSFVNLISISNDDTLLREKLIAIEQRATSKYQIFLHALVSSGTGLRLTWASPEPSRNTEIDLPVATAAFALKTVRAVSSELGELRTSLGSFVGIQLLGSNSFTAVLADDEHIYRGKIMDAARAEADHATMNKMYVLSIRERFDVSSAGEEKVKYELEKIEDVGADV